MPHLSPIEIAERPSLEAFRRDFWRPGRPVLIRGALDTWPALGRWSPADIASRFPDFRAVAYSFPGGRCRFDDKTGYVLQEMGIGEFVGHLEDPEVRYFLRVPMKEAPARLRDEVPPPLYCRDGLALRANLWFAAGGTTVGLHQDLPSNLLAQVVGAKRVVLFAPEQAPNLYRHPIASSLPHVSQVDPAEPDYKRFPRYRYSEGFECVVQPGELLFIPDRWWHFTQTPQTSMAVNYWWVTALKWPVIRGADLFKRVRQLDI